MSQLLLQLTYISTRHPSMSNAQVERILAVSRIRNATNGLTGLLLFNGQRFLQHLEGKPAAVEATYARIAQDPRHRALVVLSRVTASTRVFPRWRMAFEQTAGAAPGDQLSLVDQVAAVVDGCDPKVARHFMGYARLTSGSAA